ncbi:glucosaminidase domain-containing protein [Sulfurospirillum sp.]|nr:glucosaminidase domain-containing protein [Sulfurospirillum sp.]
MKPIFKILIGFTCSTVFLFGTGFPASYYKLNGKVQKREFINILKPLIDVSNQKTLKDRVFIENFFNKALSSSFRSLNPDDLKRLLRISKQYRVKNIFDRDTYLKRVDIVPVPLALVQGAIESGWGKSRFVREANNIFGHWTWGEIGIIPLGREEGKNHKIRIFNTLQGSVDAYILNLNRHYAYRDFRKARLEKREEGKALTGYDAAKTMINYSELREKYVDMLHKMMEEHRLLYYDVAETQKAKGLL